MRMIRRRARRPAGAQRGITMVELLIVMSILTVVSSMILMSWISMQKSYAQTSRASQSREFARDAVARLTQEIRDAQGSNQGSAITEAETNKIVFFSTFNTADNATPGTTPRQSAFVYQVASGATSGKIYRIVDVDQVADGVGDEIDNLATYGRVIVDNVVNCSNPSTGSPTPVFTYSYYNAEGVYTTTSAADSIVPPASVTTIRAVHIRTMTDLNPGKSPVYMDLQTTAQPRNMRPAT